MLSRVSTLNFHQRNLTGITSNQSVLDLLNRQISSGKQYSTFTEMSKNGNIERVFSFESGISSADNYLSTNTVVSNRLNGQATNIDQIISVMEDYRSNLLTARSSSGNTMPLDLIATNYLNQVADNLNASVEGRFIFSGARTSEPAVKDLQLSNIVNEDSTASYYNGDMVPLSVRASATLTINYGVNASDPAFQDAIGALHLGIQGHNGNDDDMLQKAVDMTNDAIKELIQVRTNINNNIVAIDKVNAEHKSAKLYLKQVMGEVVDTDVPTATITMTTHQTILQASFITFSRLSQLSLSNYLK